MRLGKAQRDTIRGYKTRANGYQKKDPERGPTKRDP